MRFRDLLKTDTPEDLYLSLRRTLPLIGDTADIYRMANDVFFWGDKIKKEWAYSYRWPVKQSD
jgi:CRISPR system Cascade subunit CasB